MKELQLTDQEVQALVGSALRERLKKAGFTMGRSDGEFPASLWVAVNLNLIGWCTFTRSSDGVWTFQQDEDRIAERVADAGEAHAETIMKRQ